jgi:DNA-binding Lrp family transcriptional regulator
MNHKDIISMTRKELKRLYFIHKAIQKEVTQKEAAESIGLSERQVRRIIARINDEGDSGIIHKSRGKSSNRKIALKDKIIKLYKTKYPDFGPTLASEKLLEIDKIQVGDETLRLWLHEINHLEYKTRKRRQHRKWRQRRSSFGQLVQIDGSHHDWLEGRGPKLVLMGYIDDATGKVHGKFYDYEGTLPAMDSFYGYIRKYGIPQSAYMDKHSTYKSQAEPTIEQELKGEVPKSQFERRLEELGIEVIHAHSAPAKGRIERLFGTFQDRLVKELRLKKIKTKEEANKFLQEFLPKYNRKFQVVPKSTANVHRPIPKSLDLKRALSIKTMRLLHKDNTVWHDKKIFLLDTRWTKQKAPKEILLEERIDGKTYLMHQDQALKYKEVKNPPKRIQSKKKKVYTSYKSIPAKDHPWRKYSNKSQYQKIRPNYLRLKPIRDTFRGMHEVNHTPKNGSLSTYPQAFTKKEKEKKQKKEKERTAATILIS